MEKIELLEVVTEDGIPTGVVLPRKEIHEKNLLHKEIAVFIINQDKKVLLQKRSKNKKSKPLCWGSSCAGHVDVNESFEISAIRELKEELGITVTKNELKPILLKKLRKGKSNSHIRSWYFIETNLDIKDFILQKEEVEEVRWFDINEIISNIGNDTFTFKEDSIEPLTRLKEIIEEK